MLFVTCLIAFLATTPCLFVIRYVKNRPAWWIIYLVIALVGWATANGTVFFYYEHFRELLSLYESPPPELVERLISDGAKRAFTLIFGWLYALFYSLPWLVVYFIATIIKARRQVP